MYRKGTFSRTTEPALFLHASMLPLIHTSLDDGRFHEFHHGIFTPHEKSHTPPVFPAGRRLNGSLDCVGSYTPTVRELPTALGYQPRTFGSSSFAFWTTINDPRLPVTSAFVRVFASSWSRLRTSFWTMNCDIHCPVVLT